MRLSQIRQGMACRVERIPEGLLKQRLAQFGLTEQMTVKCRLARRRIVALQWPGTVVAVRRKNIEDVVCGVMECGH